MPTLSKHYAIVTLPNGDQIEPISVNVTADETWAPYIQASIVVPTNLITDDIDPRTGSRIKLRLQQDFGDLIHIYELTEDFGGSVSAVTAAYSPVLNASITRSYSRPWNIFEQGLPLSTVTTAFTPVTPLKLTNAGLATVWRMSKFLQDEGTFNPEPSTIFLADLGVRSISYDYVSKEATLELASDEALAQDVHGYGDDVMVKYYSLRDLVNEALSFIFAELEPGAANEAYPFGYNLEKYEVNVGNTLWDFIETVTTASGFRVYCDELRRWYLVESTAVIGDLVLDDTDNITAFNKSFSRDTLWYNQAVIEYEDPTIGTVFDSYYATGTGALRTFYQKKENMTFPGIGAAQAIVERSLTRGETYSVEAIANFDARPQQNLVVDITGEPVKTGIVQSITWALPSARMSVDIRNLEEV
jgi:hypothetical protein